MNRDKKVINSGLERQVILEYFDIYLDLSDNYNDLIKMLPKGSIDAGSFDDLISMKVYRNLVRRAKGVIESGQLDMDINWIEGLYSSIIDAISNINEGCNLLEDLIINTKFRENIN